MTMRRRVGVLLLAVAVPVALVLWPLFLAFSLVPLVGFFTLPSVLACSILLLYGTAWLAYLVLVPPSAALRLPLSPGRCYRICRSVVVHAREAWQLNVGGLAMDWAYRRVMVLGSKGRDNIVRENLPYGSATGNRKLDLYLPLRRAHGSSRGQQQGSAEDTDDSSAETASVPVVVFIPGGGWAFSDKRYYLQLALTLRKKGLMVVVPDIATYPEGTAKDMVSDVRSVLAWTARSAAKYGGNPKAIYVAGHGSGAHLSLLSIVQEAVVRSRDSYWLASFSNSTSATTTHANSDSEGEHDLEEGAEEGEDTTHDDEASEPGQYSGKGSSGKHKLPGMQKHSVKRGRRPHGRRPRDTERCDDDEGADEDEEYETGNASEPIEITAGIRRLEIWGAGGVVMPSIKGLILLAGVSDVIKHIRYEFKNGVEEISPLRKALGPSHASCLMASPSHLIFGAKQIINTDFLPEHFLLVHGGADRDIPIVQTVLLRTLLQGVGVKNVVFKAYRDLTHLECVTALMGPRRSKYSGMLLSEIVGLIAKAEKAN